VIVTTYSKYTSQRLYLNIHWYSTNYNAILHTRQCNAMPCNATQCNAIQHYTTAHSTRHKLYNTTWIQAGSRYCIPIIPITWRIGWQWSCIVSVYTICNLYKRIAVALHDIALHCIGSHSVLYWQCIVQLESTSTQCCGLRVVDCGFQDRMMSHSDVYCIVAVCDSVAVMLLRYSTAFYIIAITCNCIVLLCVQCSVRLYV